MEFNVAKKFLELFYETNFITINKWIWKFISEEIYIYIYTKKQKKYLLGNSNVFKKRKIHGFERFALEL